MTLPVKTLPVNPWYPLNPLVPIEPLVPTESAVPINLPTCDPEDPEVRFIEKNDEWAYINDPTYRVFCVYPGDYTGRGTIRITSDGEPENERWIRLYDPQAPDDKTTLPVAVDDTRRAIIKNFEFGSEGDPANDWIVDRITKRGSSAIFISEGSERIIMNRMLMELGEGFLLMLQNTKDVTLQNSVLRQTELVPYTDRHCINITQSHQGVRITNNEIYDCAGDGIQFGPDAAGGAFIYNNDIYVTPSLYSDCLGNLDPNGSCACAENAIDMKGPGGRVFPLAENEWVRFEHNRVWGFRPTDINCGGTGSPGQSVTIGSGAENHVNFIEIKNNIIMDGPSGVEIGMATVDHISITGNLIYGIKQFQPDLYYGAITCLSGDSVEIYLNTIINTAYWLRIGPNADHNDVRCNLAINGNARPFASEIYGEESIADYNFFYNTGDFTTEGGQNHDLVFDTAADAMNEEYCFYRRQWTGPELVCIPNARSTATSPHHYACDPLLGQRNGIGVSNDTVEIFSNLLAR